MAIFLVFYAFISNVALAVVPHEPVVIWYGTQLGVWPTAMLATVGTVAASWVDHRLFAGLVMRRAGAASTTGVVARVLRGFGRAPFAFIIGSGLTPLPFFPFKVLAFANRYPVNRYLAAVAIGRFPRYLLLAWMGVALRLPTWALVAGLIGLTLITFRGISWQPRGES